MAGAYRRPGPVPRRTKTRGAPNRTLLAGVGACGGRCPHGIGAQPSRLIGSSGGALHKAATRCGPRPRFRDTILAYVEIYRSARKKHGVDDADIGHAVDHAMAVGEQDDGKVLYLGPDRSGRMLEVVSVRHDDETEIVIHAMVMRLGYERLLRGKELDDDLRDVSWAIDGGGGAHRRGAGGHGREAQAGLDVTRLRRRPGRPAMGSGPATFPVRLEPELRQALDDQPPPSRPRRRMWSVERCASTSRSLTAPRLDTPSPRGQRAAPAMKVATM